MGRPVRPARELRARFVFAACLITAAACARLLPHPPNVTPVGALALFGGACFASRRSALLVPLGAMLLSDLALEALFGHGLHRLLPVVYACVALTAWGGRLLRTRRRPVPIAAASVAAATLFFLVTNLAVWLGSPVWPQNVAGLLACYTAALPFFGNTLLGQLGGSALLFGALALAERGRPAWQSVEVGR